MSLKRQAIIVDIDGTLTVNGGRDPFDWSMVKHDRPNTNVVEVVQALKQAGNSIVFVSGRSYACFDDTLEWLNANLPGWLVQPTDLFMRADADERPDEVVKRELYETLIQPRYSVLCVLDDRNSVVQMWRSIGLLCLQVADAPF